MTIDDHWSLIITLWLFNIAMENGPFIDDVPINTSIYGWDFPVSYVSHNQMVLSIIIYQPVGKGHLWSQIMIIDN